MTEAGLFELTLADLFPIRVLVRMGLVTIAKLKEVRPYIIVGAFVIAAIVTPPDVVSQFSLAIPMCLLFELGLLVAPIFVRATQAPEEAS